jgi:hydroxyacylglutathione hydrolase
MLSLVTKFRQMFFECRLMKKFSVLGSLWAGLLLPALTLPLCAQQLHPWFKVKQISNSVWRISDNDIDNIYLIAGRDSALLIDNGVGAVNLRDFIPTLTNLPLIVVNTHAHPDHTGSNHQFKRVRAHEDEIEGVRFFGTKEMRATMAKAMTPGGQSPPLADSILFHISDSLYTPTLLPFADGHIFELGNRKIQVIHVPGHTKGSICLLDQQEKLLFTGDNNNMLVWLHPQDAQPLETYLHSLRKLWSREKEYVTLYPGHGEPIDKAFITEQIRCVEDIIAGACAGKPYDSFVGKGLLCSYKRAKVAYDPAKIRK